MGITDAIRSKIMSEQELLGRLAEHRGAGRKVVWCHGCFDVVHPGHIRHLTEAASRGDVLVVSVTADEFVGKGKDRPFVPEGLRCENLAALAMVDHVVINRAAWSGDLLERARPDVYVKGVEYTTNNDPRFLREKEIVERHGGAVSYTSGEVVYSSSRIQRERLHEEDLDAERLRNVASRFGLTRRSLTARLRAVEGLAVTVTGDILLDHYVECEQGGETAEAPILQVTPIERRFYVGGAGVLALHARALGARASVVGFFRDPPSPGLPDPAAMLEEAGVRVFATPTAVGLRKIRYLVDGQKVFKINHCRLIPVDSADRDHWFGQLAAALTGTDGMIAVDFGYNALDVERMRAACGLAGERGVRRFGDVSSGRYASLGKFAGLDLECLFPSEAEVRSWLGEPALGLPLLASRVFDTRAAERVVITMGPRGLVAFDRDLVTVGADGLRQYGSVYLPTMASSVVDPLGAGDTLTAVASLVRLAGGSLVESAWLGAMAAARTVRRFGNEPLRAEQLLLDIERSPWLGD
jgi:rfaE bifunctional protein nucleotidyltransferase chain/domain